MASSFPLRPLQQTQLQLSSFTHCKCSSTLNTFKFHCFSDITATFSQAKHTLDSRLSPVLVVKARVAQLVETSHSCTDQERPISITSSRDNNGNGSRFSSFGLKDKRVDEKHLETSGFNAVLEDNIKKRVILKDRHAKSGPGSGNRRKMGSRNSSVNSKTERESSVQNSANPRGNNDVVRQKAEKISKKGDGMENVKGSHKSKVEAPGASLRVGLDMCSKWGDVMSAIRLYDLAKKEGIKMGQYHYAVLLYLCSSAATGVVQPAKSGSGSRSLSPLDSSQEVSSGKYEELGRNVPHEMDMEGPNSMFVSKTFEKLDLNANHFSAVVLEGGSQSNPRGVAELAESSNGSAKPHPQTLDELVQIMKKNADSSKIRNGIGGREDLGIPISEDVKKYALQRGFEIYDQMCLEKVAMNEATLTSVARMAMSMGDGDKAFDIVKQMKELGIQPRLRSYGPALSVFCNKGDVEKAFIVEKHMLEHGVYPEEPELEALLRVSIETGRSDKVYYLLHKLRTSVRQVSPPTAELIEKWFKGKLASRVGKRKWDQKLIKEATVNGGGGWHGQGWLGNGKWNVSRTSIQSDGLCTCCGEKLVTIDLDPTETENFAKSVASIAAQREKNAGFQKFQKWLDYYGPFEAVIDGANVGLYSQRRFKPSKVNAIVNGIRQVLPSKKWPLIVLHNRRITGDKMDEPTNKSLIEKWKNADALYATPTGSNDDWYWLYAAIKFKCLIVTNDEMRDHLFQLLGNDFFPKWKERHQVRFSFSETGPEFRMPPPCSVVIQESEKGHWHIPIKSEVESEGERTWLCVTRSSSLAARRESASMHQESHTPQSIKGQASSGTEGKPQIKLPLQRHQKHDGKKQETGDVYRNLKYILSSCISSDRQSILKELEAAEIVGRCVVDFQI